MIENKIKLVIWDMDETFWEGTLTETSTRIPKTNIACVRELVDRGIMNSISSKNNYDDVKNKLEDAGIWDLFVFPKIGWDNKGMQIKKLIQQCNLREQNVLFIDDNVHNLEEAKFVCPMLNVETPNIIHGLLNNKFLEGNDDREHERLKQFKILEAKFIDKNNYHSNEEFLYQSNIRVNIGKDCKLYEKRLLDLINRSNQLNYTKIRLSEQELTDILNDSTYDTYYVSVSDRYGDYGIIGFVAIKNNLAVHFLFSCRVIGLGVEKYVYAEMNYPELDTVGEVASQLGNREPKPGWINQSESENRTSVLPAPAHPNKIKKAKILIRGGCDLSQLKPYLPDDNIQCEFNHLRYHRDHTVFALMAYMRNEDHMAETLNQILDRCPFLYENAFTTDMYNEDNDVVVISVLMDYEQAVYYFHGEKDLKIAYGNFDNPLSRQNLASFRAEELEWFFRNFTGGERISYTDFDNNLQFIRDHIPSHVKLVIINGAEVSHENPNEPDRYLIHREYNHVVDCFVKRNQNTELLDVRKLVTCRNDLTDNIRHYQRNIYYEMARELSRIIYGTDITEDYKVSKSKNKILLKFLKRVKEKCLKIFNVW